MRSDGRRPPTAKDPPGMKMEPNSDVIGTRSPVSGQTAPSVGAAPPVPSLTSLPCESVEMLTRRIVVGSYAVPLPEGDPRHVDGDVTNTHRWYLWVRAEDGRTLSGLVSKVNFGLHPTFPAPNRIVSKEPYFIEEVGWGEFEVHVTFYVGNRCAEPKIVVGHQLRLYEQGTDISSAIKDVRAPVVNETVFDLLVINPGFIQRDSILRCRFQNADAPKLAVGSAVGSRGLTRYQPLITDFKDQLDAAAVTIRDECRVLEAEIERLMVETTKMMEVSYFICPENITQHYSSMSNESRGDAENDPKVPQLVDKDLLDLLMRIGMADS